MVCFSNPLSSACPAQQKVAGREPSALTAFVSLFLVLASVITPPRGAAVNDRKAGKLRASAANGDLRLKPSPAARMNISELIVRRPAWLTVLHSMRRHGIVPEGPGNSQRKGGARLCRRSARGAPSAWKGLLVGQKASSARPCPTCERRFHRHCEATGALAVSISCVLLASCIVLHC